MKSKRPVLLFTVGILLMVSNGLDLAGSSARLLFGGYFFVITMSEKNAQQGIWMICYLLALIALALLRFAAGLMGVRYSGGLQRAGRLLRLGGTAFILSAAMAGLDWAFHPFMGRLGAVSGYDLLLLAVYLAAAWDLKRMMRPGE